MYGYFVKFCWMNFQCHLAKITTMHLLKTFRFFNIIASLNQKFIYINFTMCIVTVNVRFNLKKKFKTNFYYFYKYVCIHIFIGDACDLRLFKFACYLNE